MSAPSTVGRVIFGGDDSTSRMQLAVEGSTAADGLRTELDRLGGEARAAVLTQLRLALDELLGSSVADVLAAAWRGHAELVAAARRSLVEPRRAEDVDLGEHHVEVEDSLDLEVTVDGVQIGALHLALVARCRLHAARAHVADGRLLSIRGGGGRLDVEVRVGEHTVAGDGADLALTIDHPFRPPITISEPDAAPVAAAADQPSATSLAMRPTPSARSSSPSA